MQKCLGIYIEENLIKYAKVSKDRDDMKVESFGIRFFQNLSEELSKVIEETYSFNTPISINLANEKYLYFDVFALLNKKDVEKTIQTEFENFCDEKNYNNNAFETRFALMPNKDDQEKIRALDIFINKIEMNRQLEPLSKYRVTKLMPISIAIGNIARLNKRENQIIVNMEETTTVTTIYDNQIYKVDTIEVGSKEVLDNINKLENSYAKAYDICKNTTIYTAESEELGEEQPYLQQIMPTIYKIAEELQTIMSEDATKIQTVYLTGTLASINNIDLYFQEFFPDTECKILKPKVVDEAITKINIKEYVEVNSAIALATVGLGEGIQELNFKKEKTTDKLLGLFGSGKDSTSNGKGKENEKGKNSGKKNISFDFKSKLTTIEGIMIRTIAGILTILLIFVIYSKLLSAQQLKKEEEIKELIKQENSEIQKINTDIAKLDTKTDKYKNLIIDLDKMNEKINDISARRNTIPNLLYQIMAHVPDKVQLVQIENTIDRTIVINAQSYDYDQLGYFIAILKTKKILKNVITSSSAKPNGVIMISIEGELP